MSQVQKGLEGVIADTTSISLVDGEAGQLYYRGYPVESLVQHPFAAVANLILFGELPDARRLAEIEEFLWNAGRLPAATAQILSELARQGAHPMATLQAILPLLGFEPPETSLTQPAEMREGLVIASRIPAAIASIFATIEGRPEHPYPESRRYGERYLALLHGRTPSAEEVEAFECMQILQLDHGFNASTFTARVVTSTLAPVSSALSAAMGALYGPLHGAADQGALEMALEVGHPDVADKFVEECLRTGKRVLGMGHREYRVVDPRSKVMKAMARKIATQPEHDRLFETLSAVESAFVERTAAKRRALRANMEFYKGVVFLALGIPKELFTATFAASRVFGWVAHTIEQRKDNRIIRPAALYVGPPPRDDQ